MENSVFAIFGGAFLERVYRHFACSKHAIAYVYEVDGQAQAVIASTSRRRAFLRGLALHSGIPLMALSIRAMLRSGACRRMVWRMPAYLGKTCRGITQAEMIFITVAPTCRKKGVARELIRMTLEEYERRGVKQIHVSIESANTVIRTLLEEFGFKRVDHFTFADKPNDLLALTR